MTLQTMTRPLAEVRAYLDELLKVAGLDEDGNGLVIDGRPAVAKVGLAVNCSFQAIDRAVARGCDLLITHHAAWPEIDLHLSERKYGRLREHEMSLYVAHECLDLARDFGTMDALARAVKVAVQAPFGPTAAAASDGAAASPAAAAHEFGVHGITTGHFSEFVVRVGNQLGAEPRAWKNTDSFGHIGITPGWGGRTDWMARAQELGCDTFLTGETSMFGILFAREAGLNLVVAGHYVTETPGVMALGARLARDLHVDVTFIPEDAVEQMG
jgi:putative NIF3 family GTP cyclohydrolase 1 type 2